VLPPFEKEQIQAVHIEDFAQVFNILLLVFSGSLFNLAGFRIPWTVVSLRHLPSRPIFVRKTNDKLPQSLSADPPSGTLLHPLCTAPLRLP